MKPHRQDELAIANQAAEWLTALEAGDASQRAAFAEWLVQSPVHVREFLNLTAVHRLFDNVDPQRRVDTEALVGDFAGNVVRLDDPSRLPTAGATVTAPAKQASAPAERAARRRQYGFAGIAAAVAAAAGFGWWSLTPASWQRFETAVGEQRSIELEDGSLIHLSAQSRLEARFDDGARAIRLLQGEALFTVQRDARRPFRVHAASAVIQAVGTKFDVNRRSRDITVSVIEGAVRVMGHAGKRTPISLPPAASGEENGRDVLLTAGSAVRVARSGALSSPEMVDAHRVTAWRERRFVFQSDTLEDMAAEFNRYNRSPKVRIEGEDIRQRRFTGVLDAGHPESLLDLLAEADDLAYRKSSDELIIRAR